MELRNRTITDADVADFLVNDEEPLERPNTVNDEKNNSNAEAEVEIYPEPPKIDFTLEMQHIFEDCTTKGSTFKTGIACSSVLLSVYVLFLMDNGST